MRATQSVVKSVPHAERGNEKPVLSGSIGLPGAPHPRPLPASGARELGRIARLRQRSIQMLKTQNREVVMTSPAKVAANIRNAKKSTGPRTTSGKERARMN